MRLSFFKLMYKSSIPALASTVLWLLFSLTALASTDDDLPDGRPYDLTDSSACGGRFGDIAPQRTPWYARMDALFLKRDRFDSVPVAVVRGYDSSGYQFTSTELSTANLDSPFKAGPKVTIGHTLGDSCWEVDCTYFCTDTWVDSAAITNSSEIYNSSNVLIHNGNLYSPFTGFSTSPQNKYDWNNYVSIRESSQLRSAEFNFRYLMPMPHDCLTAKFIIGFRYMGVNEQFDYYSSHTGNAVNPTAYTSFTTRTTNDLYGPQIGLDLMFYSYKNCWFDLEFKGAICNNHAMQDNQYTSDDRDTTAYVGDIDLTFVWKLTDHWTTRIGYQAIFVNDIATAARNFDQPYSVLESGVGTLDTSGRAVYHGPHIGLECMW
jgi:hypothetical protein